MVEDIASADSTYSQFLGAIVLKDLGRAKGPTSPASYLIIDGQQRLTTLYLIFLALAHICEKHGDESTAKYIASNYLAESKSPQFAGWPKLVPTLQDRHTLWELLQTYAPDIEWDFTADPEEKKSHRSANLASQWKRILTHFAGELLDDKDKLRKQELDEALQRIQEYIRLICITLEASDDANAIFSRLNAKGVPLELADLVRNEVFSKFGADEQTKAEKYYAKRWQPFERTFPKDSLNQFFPVYAYVVFKGRVTKSGAFPKLQEKWSTDKPEMILGDLQKYSPYYCALVQFQKDGHLSAELNGQMERFSRMPKTTVTWPFLIETLRAAAEKRLNPKDALLSLRIVEAFLVRRSLIGIEPTGLHSVFKGLWDKTKGNPKEVLDKIVTRNIQCPKDSELRKALLREPSDTRVILKFVLEEYERDYVNANKFDPVPATAITIEHILPRNLHKHWRATFTSAEHRRLCSLLGNIAALSESHNKSLQDQSWEKKRKRFKGSNFKSTQDLASKPNWTPKIISERTIELTSWILNKWPSLERLKKNA